MNEPITVFDKLTCADMQRMRDEMRKDLGAPNVPLTWEELPDHRLVWLEIRHIEELVPSIFRQTMDGQAWYTMESGYVFTFSMDELGKRWRVWAKKPTDEAPEEIKKALGICNSNSMCIGCPYKGLDDCTGMETAALAYTRSWRRKNEQLHEQVCLMLIQMRGDCGVCKHKANAQMCAVCAARHDRPNWEYEGLPETPTQKKGESE